MITIYIESNYFTLENLNKVNELLNEKLTYDAFFSGAEFEIEKDDDFTYIEDSDKKSKNAPSLAFLLEEINTILRRN